MPQLSIYIDEMTLKKIETAASIEHTSISKYAVKKINESMKSGWPEHYDDLFGSINDDSFTEHQSGSFSDDLPREYL